MKKQFLTDDTMYSYNLNNNFKKVKMTNWITISPQLRQGMNIANQVDIGKFRLLISHICQSLQSSKNLKVFSEEEEEKLLLSLDLNKEDLKILLDTIILVYSKAACNLIKPNDVESFIKEFNLSEEKTSAFFTAWVAYGKGIIDNLRNSSIFPIQVKDIHWNLNVRSSSSLISKDITPIALLQLSLAGAKPPKLTVEMDKSDLIELYNSLEKIQSQLDSLK
ncbi:COMM domain-containing protein 10 isoform X2 [Prorops nasuta]|uniref:COMM domain-containing protein 10 isoform X2 n=1 Tax=Prorops nasuta TaxID=863751 RepID=UPI0034CFB894